MSSLRRSCAALSFALLVTAACSDDSSSGTNEQDGGSGTGGSGTGGSGTGGSGTGGAGGTASGGSGGSAGGSGGGAGVNTGGAAGTGGAGGSSGTGGSGGGSCLVDGFLTSIGKSKLMVGASMSDATAKLAPFDLRYLYISGGIADGNGPCGSCASACNSSGTSCANSVGCAWWGCWQYDQDPPGAYLRDFFSRAKTDGQIPMVTYYMILQASGVAEGMAEVTKANDAAFMARYYSDYRFVVQQIKTDTVFMHIEPDFWGYAQQMNDDPTKIPAAVASANPTDCAALPNTIAGMGECMIRMTKKYATNARVGLHGSGWATKMDVLQNKNANFNVNAEATKLANFIKAAGPSADFVVVDASDRDAAWYDTQGQDRWWDDTNQTLPNFTQAFTWSKTLAESAGKPILWWQLPVGNMSLNNTNQHWRDNRVDYLLTHMDQVALAHGLGVAFGAGDGNQTTPETDGGNLVSKVNAYAQAGGQAACP